MTRVIVRAAVMMLLVMHHLNQRDEACGRLSDAPVQVPIALLERKQLAPEDVVGFLQFARIRDQRRDAFLQCGKLVIHGFAAL